MIKKQTSLAIAAVLGTALVGSATAATLAPGDYTMTIRTTPTLYGLGIPDVGCVGTVCANTSFTFGGFPSATQSNTVTDNGVTVNGFGGVAGDGHAGVISLTVNADSSLSFTGGSVDTILGTAAANFAQNLNLGSWTGSIDAAGNIDFTPTGREGNTSNPVISNARWNVDDFNDPGGNTWTDFTTGTSGGTVLGDTTTSSTIAGQALDASNHAVLVSSSTVGGDFGSFFGGVYYEAWSVDFAPAAVIPVPAAVWLFGSGLIGLVGVARRRKNA